MKKIVIGVSLLAIVSLFVVLEPVYQFYAHRGAVPFVPWGEIRIPSESPEQHTVFDGAFEVAATESLQHLQQHKLAINSPGITAAVGIHGKLVWAGAAGWADIDEQRPMTTDTQLRIGSTSKALTSTLLARQVQLDTLTLDTPLSSLSIGQRNEQWGNIKVRHLASHTAGLPHYKENTERLGLYHSIALQKHYANVDQAVDLFDESKMLFEPGTDFSYSSFGTVLLSAVLQETGQQCFQSQMKALVLKPLSMADTLMSERETQKSKLTKFYWREDETDNKVREWRDVDLSHRLAGGGFVSTSADLVRLGLGFIDDTFISSSTRRAFWTPQTLSSGEVNEQGYAIGWRVYEQDFGEGIGALKVAHHGGVSRGAQSWLMVIPERDMVVAVNINTKTQRFGDFAKVSLPIAQAFLNADVTASLTE